MSAAGSEAAAGGASVSLADLEAAVARGRGVLFAEPALVGRPSYVGRDLIAKNSEFTAETMDSRG